jgi:hypothetical protein
MQVKPGHNVMSSRPSAASGGIFVPTERSESNGLATAGMTARTSPGHLCRLPFGTLSMYHIALGLLSTASRGMLRCRDRARLDFPTAPRTFSAEDLAWPRSSEDRAVVS